MWPKSSNVEIGMTFPTPFNSSLMTVQDEWIDYNGHMNVAYYIVLFDRCIDPVVLNGHQRRFERRREIHSDLNIAAFWPQQASGALAV